MSVAFNARWCGTGLGAFRPCEHTYCRYLYSSVPILDDSRFTGAFEWLGAPGEIDPARVAKLGDLNVQLSAEGLALPQDFIAFQTRTELSGALDAVSVTGCWTHLPERPIASPVEPGAFLVRFLRDQQDCVTWYLYLRASGEAFVAHAYDDDPEDEEIADEIFWCAPSFEQFAYRFWIENRLSLALLIAPTEPLAPELVDYLAHYRR